MSNLLEKLEYTKYVVIMHLVGCIPFLGVIISYIMWRYNKNISFVNSHGREAFKFQFTMTFGLSISLYGTYVLLELLVLAAESSSFELNLNPIFLIFILLMPVLMLVILISMFVFSFSAAIHAYHQKFYPYPFSSSRKVWLQHSMLRE